MGRGQQHDYFCSVMETPVLFFSLVFFSYFSKSFGVVCLDIPRVIFYSLSHSSSPIPLPLFCCIPSFLSFPSLPFLYLTLSSISFPPLPLCPFPCCQLFPAPHSSAVGLCLGISGKCCRHLGRGSELSCYVMGTVCCFEFVVLFIFS